MTIKITCPHCQQHIEAPSTIVGTVVSCSTCNRQFQVPPKLPPQPPFLPQTQIMAKGLQWRSLRRWSPPLQTQIGAKEKIPSCDASTTAFTMQGVHDLLEVYRDKVAITPKGVMGFLAKGLKGTKTIPFHSITAIQFKKAGFTSGYMQFTIPGGRESHGGVVAAASDENSFMFDDTGNNNEQALHIKNYIESRVQETRAPKSAPSSSLADELQKLANLRRDGILSEDEFNAAKRRLLGT